ncbi:MAG: ABC transporter permease [Saprospiraceae bacterium]|nr:ABC transporter permease [Saprospiraceae bacterium]
MLFHIKRTVRNLWNNRLYSLLNLFGLATGMAAAMLIALWVQNELRFDSYHPNADNIWRLKTDLRINETETWNWGSTPLKTPELCAQTPGITATAQIMKPYGLSAVVQRGAELFDEKNYGFVGPGWFNMFQYDFAEGDASGFGERPNDMLITESLAAKIFGRRSALGATLRMDSVDYVIHGVLRDPRPESSFRENMLLPIEAWLKRGNYRKNDESWNNFNYTTFIELRPDASPEAAGAQLTQLLTEAKQDSNITLKLGALRDLHFDRSLKDDLFDKGSRRSVTAFSLIGALILLMAAINYVGLTTARAQTRAREAGIRKVVGASKAGLFAQFLGESALLASASGAIALILVHLSLPMFSELAGRSFSLPWNSALPWLLLGGTTLATIALSGIYPALLMAGFNPIQALRGQGATPARSLFRQSLVVAQFAISVALLIATIVIGKQRAYIQNKDMGYDRDQIFTFAINWSLQRSLGVERSKTMVQNIDQTLRNSTTIAGLSQANDSPVHLQSTHSGSVKFDGLAEDAKPTVSILATDAYFADLFKLQLAEGRWFERGNKSDENNYVLNETAARQLGLPKPWLGQRFSLYDTEGLVIGIVKDFHFLPLHEKVPPLVAHNMPQWHGNFFVKTHPGKSKEALAVAESAWKAWFPNYPFKYTFLSEDFNRMYENEQRAASLFNLFSGIAGLLACLGLFGLATFVAVQRTKEIGVRKVLGASVTGITRLLTFDFLKLVLIAVLVAIPPAYYFMQQWLQDFAYRISLEWQIFALAGLIAVLVAFLTVGVQSVRAALADPVNSLRNE